MRKIVLYTFAAMMTVLGCSGGRVSDNAFDTQSVETILTVGVKDFAKALNDTAHVRLVDVRTAKEYAEGHIAGAINIDVNQLDFEQRTAKFVDLNDTRVAVYCRSGRRSMKAAESLSQRGVIVLNLDGGITAWQRDGKPVVKN